MTAVLTSSIGMMDDSSGIFQELHRIQGNQR
jgi:hypothetical protein